jgi:regulatory protein
LRAQDARAAALALLARRDFASAELKEKLRSQGYPLETVAEAIAALTQERLLDDGGYAARQVESRAGRGQGPLKIGEHLRSLGLSPELIEAALAGTDWVALAKEARRRRFGPERPRTRADLARQARFLQYRGFSSDHIRSAIGAELDPD